MNDNIKIKGFFSMNVFRIVDGIKYLIENYFDENLIVINGKNLLTKLINNDGTTNFINKIGFGEGTSEPLLADIDLTNKYIRTVIGSEYDTDTSVIFSWELLASEAIGKKITEYGLFSDGEVLFSRKIRALIEKEDDIVLEGTWRINFL